MVVHLLQNQVEKKYFFFEKICFLQNIHYLHKKCFYMEKKSFILRIFLLKKTFTEKNINENVKTYIFHLRNIFLCKKCLCYK